MSKSNFEIEMDQLEISTGQIDDDLDNNGDNGGGAPDPNEDVIVIEDIEKGTSTPSENHGAQPSPLEFASALREKGILTELDEEKLKDAEDPFEVLFNQFDEEVKKRVNDYKESLDPEKKKEIEDLEKGVDIQTKKQLEQDLKYLESLNDKSFNDIDLAKKILTFDLKERGYTDKQVQDQINDYESLDKLEIKAKESAENLIAVTKKDLSGLEEIAAKNKEAELKRQEGELKKVTETVMSMNEVFEGYKLTDKAKQDLVKSLTKPVEMDSKGRPLSPVAKKQAEDPLKFDIILHWLNMNGVFDGDLKVFNKKETSNAVDKFKRNFNRVETPGSDDDFISSLKKITD